MSDNNEKKTTEEQKAYIKSLRAKYETVTGKKVYNGWSVEELLTKIAFIKGKRAVRGFKTKENAEDVAVHYQKKGFKTKVLHEKGNFVLYVAK